jgi:hypothetical protein
MKTRLLPDIPRFGKQQHRIVRIYPFVHSTGFRRKRGSRLKAGLPTRSTFSEPWKKSFQGSEACYTASRSGSHVGYHQK